MNFQKKPHELSKKSQKYDLSKNHIQWSHQKVM